MKSFLYQRKRNDVNKTFVLMNSFKNKKMSVFAYEIQEGYSQDDVEINESAQPYLSIPTAWRYHLPKACWLTKDFVPVPVYA